MARKKTAAAPIDTAKGTAAYRLAMAHEAELAPRLPGGTLTSLSADLTLLGADPNPPPPAAPTGSPGPAPPTLAEAVSGAVEIISAVREAIHGAKAPTAVRKAYGVSGKTPSKEPRAVVAEGRRILTQAQADPTEALSLGILTTDTDALAKSLDDVAAAEAAAIAKGAGSKGTVTARAKREAEARVHEAVARIAGVGILAFARNAAVRDAFAALKAKA